MRCMLVTIMLGLCFGIFAVEKASAAGGKVLLALEETRFKKGLVQAMQKELEEAGFQVSVIEHSKKGLKANAADYDAVFITNSGVHSKVRPWITKWLEDNKAGREKIVLHTTQTSDWKVIADVDAVTSASVRKDTEKLASEYVKKLKKIATKG